MCIHFVKSDARVFGGKASALFSSFFTTPLARSLSAYLGVARELAINRRGSETKGGVERAPCCYPPVDR